VNGKVAESPRGAVPSLDPLAAKSTDFFEFLNLLAASLKGKGFVLSELSDRTIRFVSLPS
jgi:hypothetical protein